MKKPMLTVNTLKKNLGTVAKNQVLTIEYVVSNPTAEPVLCTGLWSSCGCTTPDIEKNPIPPFSSVKLIGKFDTTNRKGLQEKALGVNYKINNQEQTLRVSFTANVE
jgi:hypothetical protein